MQSAKSALALGHWSANLSSAPRTNHLPTEMQLRVSIDMDTHVATATVAIRSCSRLPVLSHLSLTSRANFISVRVETCASINTDSHVAAAMVANSFSLQLLASPHVSPHQSKDS